MYSSKEEMDKALVLMKENVDRIIEDLIPVVEKMPAPASQLIPQSHVHWLKVDQSGLDQQMSQVTRVVETIPGG